MKASNSLMVILGFTSSLVLAQSVQPQVPSEDPSRQTPSSSETQIQPADQAQPQSSGSSGQSDSETSSPSQAGSRRSMPAGDRGQAQPAPAPMTQLEPKNENGFTYLCGGVGADESAQLKKAARNYDMMLTFATRKGNFLSDVKVDVKDAKGSTELQTTCGGPIMLIDFPKNGTYHIHADYGGYTLDKTARVQAKGRSHASLVLTWPQQVAESSASAPTSSGSSGSDNDNTSSGGSNSSR
jgi:hypothetical protein